MNFIFSFRKSRPLKCDVCNLRHGKNQCTQIQIGATADVACVVERNESESELKEPISAEAERTESVPDNPLASDGLYNFCPCCPAPNANNNYKTRTKLNNNYRPKQACATCYNQMKGIVKKKLTQKEKVALWEHYFGNNKDATCLGCDSQKISVSGSAGWQAAHIVASAKDGPNNIANLLPMCGSCNSTNFTNTVHPEIVKKYHAFRDNRLRPDELSTDDQYSLLGNRLTELNNHLCELSLGNAIKVATSELLWSNWESARTKYPGQNLFAGVSKDGSIRFGVL